MQAVGVYKTAFLVRSKSFCVHASEFALEIVQNVHHGLDNVKTLQGDAFNGMKPIKNKANSLMWLF